MANPIDWLGLPGTPQTGLMVAPVGARPYSLTAADALALGRETADIYRQGAEMQRLQMEQALAPQRFEYEQNKLAFDTAQMQERVRGRDAAIPAFGQLDPTSPDYLRTRQRIIAENPFSLSDPTVQQILSSNDRAYDDYLAAKRLENYGAGGMSPTQAATLYRLRNQLQEDYADAKLFGLDESRVAELESSIAEVDNLLRGGMPAAPGMPVPGAIPGAAPTAIPGAAPTAIPGAAPTAIPGAVPGAASPGARAPGPQKLPTDRKEDVDASTAQLAQALVGYADSTGDTTTGVMRLLLQMGEDDRREFFATLGYEGKDAEAVFKKLQKSPELLTNMGVSFPRAQRPADTVPQPFEKKGESGSTYKFVPLPP